MSSTTSWEVTSGALPAGLALSKEGTISGTPTATGSSTFTLKATGVEGVYSADPKREPNAKLYDEISCRDVIIEELKVIDQTAITLCRENSLPLIVLNIHRPGAIVAAVRGERVGTLVR